MRSFLSFIVIIFTITGCKKTNKTSFYFWKTTYKISSFEKQYLEKLNVQKLYVRFFDIDIKNNQAIPVGEIDIGEKNNIQEIIPVIFITNETFKILGKKEIEQLAEHTVNEIKFLYPKISSKILKEIQLDCDWTASTKDNYFYFLKQLKRHNPNITFSATIRLHQIKNQIQTGIPPVNKGVLMYYATSNPLDFQDKNSILENDVAKNYIRELNTYQISLDVALPIYGWAIIQNQLGEKRLINDIRKDNLNDTTLYQPVKPNFYKVKKDHYLSGLYIYEGFNIKTEDISKQDLTIAKKNISSKLKNKELTTIFFQLDSSNLIHYSIENLNAISK